MSADDILMDAEERMEKAAAVLKQSLIGVRTGRANPGLVDSVRVMAGNSLKALDMVTEEYPGFPTDMQAQYMALATQADARQQI